MTNSRNDEQNLMVSFVNFGHDVRRIRSCILPESVQAQKRRKFILCWVELLEKDCEKLIVKVTDGLMAKATVL